MTAYDPPRGPRTETHDSGAADVSAATRRVIHTIYRLLSGRASEPRDWTAYRRLFVPDARFTPLRDPRTHSGPQVFDLDGYVESRTILLQAADFYEVETGAELSQFGDLAHVWSAYAVSREPGGVPFSRGINSIQLIHEATDWRVVSVVWDAERAGLSVPDHLKEPR